ncbi:MAG: hypothetical protein R3D98_01195 [Candidatus Krumholzibacteriia bacterium]
MTQLKSTPMAWTGAWFQLDGAPDGREIRMHLDASAVLDLHAVDALMVILMPALEVFEGPIQTLAIVAEFHDNARHPGEVAVLDTLLGDEHPEVSAVLHRPCHPIELIPRDSLVGLAGLLPIEIECTEVVDDQTLAGPVSLRSIVEFLDDLAQGDQAVAFNLVDDQNTVMPPFLRRRHRRSIGWLRLSRIS